MLVSAEPTYLPRRRLLLAGAAAVVAAHPAGVAAASNTMKELQLVADTSGVPLPTTFVLVHGAWHGAWVWKKVVPLLRSAGAEVVTPTLTGLGDRAHLADPNTNLSLHITDVLSTLQTADLTGITLVGWSYGGMVVTGVADKAPERIANLVYLDAFLPPANTPTSLFDLAPETEQSSRDIANKSGDGWRIPQTWAGDPPTFGVTDPAEIAWLDSHLVPQPIKTFDEKLLLTTPLEARQFSRTYIIDSVQGGPFARIYSSLKGNAAWRTYELPTAHDSMVTEPFKLAMLLFAASQSA